MSGGPTTTDTNKQNATTNSFGSGKTNVSGTNTQTQTGSGTSTTNTAQSTVGDKSQQTAQDSFGTTLAYAPAKGVIDTSLGMLGNIDPNLSANEHLALAGATGLAQQQAGDYTPKINDAANYMLSGGPFDEANEKINQAYGDSTGALQRYASGDHMDLNDPTLNQLMTHVKDDITNNVGSQFAGAGRSFSGAHAGQLAKGLSHGMTPALFQYLMQGQDRQIGAANSLMGNAIGAAGAQNANAAGRIGAMSAAPGMLNAAYNPYNKMLEAGSYARNAPVDTISSIMGTAMAPAQAFSSQFGSTRGTADEQSRSATTGTSRTDYSNEQKTKTIQDLLTEYSKRARGAQSGSSVTEREGDWLTTGLGALGMFGGKMLS